MPLLEDENGLAKSLVQFDYVVLLFHANWSVDSRKFRKQFDQIRGKTQSRSIGFYEVNFKTNSIVEKFEIKKFPAIVITSAEGITLNYTGELTIAKVLDWVRLNTNHEVEVIENPTQLDNELKNADNILVIPLSNKSEIIFSEDGAHSLNKTEQFLSLKSTFRHTPIKFIDDKLLELLFAGLRLDNSLLKDVEFPTYSSIALIKNYDERINFIPSATYEELNLQQLRNRVFQAIYPFVNRLSLNYYIEVVNKQRNYVILLLRKDTYSVLTEDYSSSISKHIDLLKERESDAENHKDPKYPLIYLSNRQFYFSAHTLREYVFLKGEALDTSQTTIMLDYNLKEENFPALLVYKYRVNEAPLRYLVTRDILLEENFEKSMEDAGQFDNESINEELKVESESKDYFHDLTLSRNIRGILLQLKKGKLKPYLKSETQNENFVAKKQSYLDQNIHLLTASDYSEFFRDKEKSYLIFYTKRNNGMCREVEKEFIKLAGFLIKEKQLKFGVIDISVNDLGSDFRNDMNIILFSYKLDHSTSSASNINDLRHVIYEYPEYSKDALIDFLKLNM